MTPGAGGRLTEAEMATPGKWSTSNTHDFTDPAIINAQ